MEYHTVSPMFGHSEASNTSMSAAASYVYLCKLLLLSRYKPYFHESKHTILQTLDRQFI